MIRLLLTSGRGPTECRIAVAKCIAAMTREATRAGLAVDCAETGNDDGHGPASAVVVVDGAGACDFARQWTGSIQWIAKSPVRPHHRRKNWFIGVTLLDRPPPTAAELRTQDVRFTPQRGAGPGGQHQNKTESAVRALHVPTGLCVVAAQERSQHANKARALERLRVLLATTAELAATVDRQTKQAAHDALERGHAVKRFHGEAFQPE